MILLRVYFEVLTVPNNTSRDNEDYEAHRAGAALHKKNIPSQLLRLALEAKAVAFCVCFVKTSRQGRSTIEVKINGKVHPGVGVKGTPFGGPPRGSVVSR